MNNLKVNFFLFTCYHLAYSFIIFVTVLVNVSSLRQLFFFLSIAVDNTSSAYHLSSLAGLQDLIADGIFSKNGQLMKVRLRGFRNFREVVEFGCSISHGYKVRLNLGTVLNVVATVCSFVRAVC